MQVIKEIKTNNGVIRKHKCSIISLYHPDNIKKSEMEDFIQNYEALLKVQAGEISPFLIITNNVSTVSSEGKVFMTKTLPTIANSMAMVPKSALAKFAVNLFLYINRPNIPTKAFSSEEKAVEWLKQFLKND